MSTRTRVTAEVERVNYAPSGLNLLDLEVFPVSDLRRRVQRSHMLRTHRYSFHMLVLVTRGECTATIDLTSISCKPGSLVAIEPYQAHRFGAEEDWDGWMVLFRPEFLVTSRDSPDASFIGKSTRMQQLLPVHLSLQGVQRDVVEATILQMGRDAKLKVHQQTLHELLRHQLCALLLRLRTLHIDHFVQRDAMRTNLRRFRSFEQVVETKLETWRQVAQYAAFLNCSEKSLTRATMEMAGVNAKTFIASRVNLEAKRLLVHTELSVAAIAERLGFEQPTYFVKFFRREARCTPGEFRRRYRIAASS
jgi:AraC-like DNA-binding protein